MTAWTCVRCGAPRELGEFPERCECGGQAITYVPESKRSSASRPSVGEAPTPDQEKRRSA